MDNNKWPAIAFIAFIVVVFGVPMVGNVLECNRNHELQMKELDLKILQAQALYREK